MTGLGDFPLIFATFWKGPDGARGKDRRGKFKQPWQRREGAGGDDIDPTGQISDTHFDPAVQDVSRRAGLGSGAAKEGALALIAFNQGDAGTRFSGEQAGNHQTGKACPAAQVEPATCLWEKRDELRAVSNVAPPDCGQC